MLPSPSPTASTPSLVNRTSAYCCACGTTHPATIVRDGRWIRLVVACPRGEVQRTLSSDADAYLAVRAKADRAHAQYRGPIRLWYYLIEITSRCNFACPICYADTCGATPGPDLSVVDIVARGRRIRQHGGRFALLIGGEPTMRDDLPDVIRALTRFGLRVDMSTNGWRLGTEPGYAASLHRAGLSRAWLQFDTFDPQIHQRMRANASIPEKMRAADNCLRAGLKLSFTCTVTSLNLHEVGEVLAYACSLAPGLGIVNYQIAADIGRYDLPTDTFIDREAVMRALVATPALHGHVTTDDFWPVPTFAPWQMNVHPDCAANLFLFPRQGTILPGSALLDMPALMDALTTNRMHATLFTRNVVPAYYALRAARPGRRIEFLKHLAGFVTGRGPRGMVVVSVNTVFGMDYQDEERLARCASCFATDDAFVSLCVYHHRDARRPFSRKAMEHA